MGYHETITRAWFLLLQAFMKANAYGSPVEACNAMIASSTGHMYYLKHFYSKDHLLGVQARKYWVEPDIRPLEINRVMTGVQ